LCVLPLYYVQRLRTRRYRRGLAFAPDPDRTSTYADSTKARLTRDADADRNRAVPLVRRIAHGENGSSPYQIFDFCNGAYTWIHYSHFVERSNRLLANLLHPPFATGLGALSIHPRDRFVLVLDRAEYRTISGEENGHYFRDETFTTNKRRAPDGGGKPSGSQRCFSGLVVDSPNGCAQSGMALEAWFADLSTHMVFRSALLLWT